MVTLKKWTLILSEIESSVPNCQTSEDCKVLLDRFESIDENYRDHKVPKFYLLMWKIALRAGKLNISLSYAKKFLKYLVELKRTPQIKIFIHSLNEEGLFKKQRDEYYSLIEILLGKNIIISKNELLKIEAFLEHPEHWKNSSSFLKQYLLLEEDWTLNHWKLCYEYILINHSDKEIFLSLLEKIRERKNKKIEKKMISFLNSKNIKIISAKPLDLVISDRANTKLNIDYDQIAMDLIAGMKEANNEEQQKVIYSLKFITEDELQLKGMDMIIAFELLGMEQVVAFLCGKMINIESDVKKRASIYYVWAQSLFNNAELYKSLELLDIIIHKEPLYDEEQIAFLYLKAEVYLKLGKIKMAKILYLEIKKKNPHYRLIKERLSTIEKT